MILAALIIVVVGVCLVPTTLHILKDSRKWEIGILDAKIRGFNAPPNVASVWENRIAAIRAEQRQWWSIALSLGTTEILAAGLLILSLRVGKRRNEEPNHGTEHTR